MTEIMPVPRSLKLTILSAGSLCSRFLIPIITLELHRVVAPLAHGALAAQVAGSLVVVRRDGYVASTRLPAQYSAVTVLSAVTVQVEFSDTCTTQ